MNTQLNQNYFNQQTSQITQTNETSPVSNISYLPGCEPTTKSQTAPKKKEKTKSERREEKENSQIHHSAMMPLTREEVSQIKNYLLNKPVRYQVLKEMNINLRDYTLFTYNCNIGLRCEDLLNLQICDIMKNGKLLDDFDITELKTKKKKAIAHTPEIKNLLMNYINSLGEYKSDWYLFHSLWPNRNPYEPMTRRNVGYILKDVEKALDSNKVLGTHVMRKTPARILFDICAEEGNLLGMEVTQDFLNHSRPDITRGYLGITRENKLDAFTKLAEHGMI